MAVCCRFVEIVRRTNFAEFAVARLAVDRPIQVPRIRPKLLVAPFGYGRVLIIRSWCPSSTGTSFHVGTRVYAPSPVSPFDGRQIQSWHPTLNILNCFINYLYFNHQIIHRLIRQNRSNSYARQTNSSCYHVALSHMVSPLKLSNFVTDRAHDRSRIIAHP